MGELAFVAAQILLLGAAWYILPRWMSKPGGSKSHHSLPSPLHLQRLMPGICSPLATGVPLITISEAPSPIKCGSDWLGGATCGRRVSFQAVRPYKDAEEVETTVQRPLTPWMPMPSQEDIDAEIEEEEERESARAGAEAGADRIEDADEVDEADMDLFEWDVKLSGVGASVGEAVPRDSSIGSDPRVEMLN